MDQVVIDISGIHYTIDKGEHFLLLVAHVVSGLLLVDFHTCFLMIGALLHMAMPSIA
jgi:hypothetical protein